VAVLPCVQCGYDLSGLSPKGVCPECGAEVSRTLGATLRGATRGYRTRVRAGALTLLGSIQLLLLPLLLGVPLIALDFLSERVFLLCVVGAAAFAPGCWLVTCTAPGSIEARVSRVRGVARVSSGYIFVIVLFAGLSAYSERGTALLAICSLFGVAAALLAWVSTFDVIADIAGAAGDASLKKRAERSGWWPIGLLLSVPLAVLISFATEGAGLESRIGISFVAIAVSSAMWVDTSVVLMRFRKRLSTPPVA
jgi:hypothetical protein